MKVIDVHTHMLSEEYLKLLKKRGGGYQLKKVVGGQTGVFKDGSPFMTLTPCMFDYELRIKAMDAAGVDIAVVTLTSPNVYGAPPRSACRRRGSSTTTWPRVSGNIPSASASCARCPGSTRSSPWPSSSVRATSSGRSG